MTIDDWHNPETRCLGLRLAGDAIAEPDPHGDRIVDDTLLILLNAYHEDIPFILPAEDENVMWELLLSTALPLLEPPLPAFKNQAPYHLAARSLAVLRRLTT
jgi:glycogen operon protein